MKRIAARGTDANCDGVPDKSSAMSALENEPEEEDDAALLDATFFDGYLELPDLAEILFQEASVRPVRSEADWQDGLAASLLAG